MHGEDTQNIFLNSCLDNDQPIITAAHNSPAVEGGSNVLLTCNEAISQNEIVIGFEWYKNGSLIFGENKTILDIGNQREANGKYTCKVVTKYSNTSQESDEVLIAFTCKYVLYI